MSRAAFLVNLVRQHPASLNVSKAAIKALAKLLGDRGAAARLVADVRAAATARMVRVVMRRPDLVFVDVKHPVGRLSRVQAQ